MPMTRSELMAAIAARFPSLTHTDAEVSVLLILKATSDSLARGERVEIRDFGSFDIHHRPARKGRNPATGKSVQVPAKSVPHFKPGKELRERVTAAASQAIDAPARGK